MSITIQNLTLNVTFGTEIAETPNVDTPRIGDYWQNQGGIYAGDFRGDNGVEYGLVVGKGVGFEDWGVPRDSRFQLSSRNGSANSEILSSTCPAARLAMSYTSDGHSDFYLPAVLELVLAAANLSDLFNKVSWYWTSTPVNSEQAFAVEFSRGYVRGMEREDKFQVCPFRRVIKSAMRP